MQTTNSLWKRDEKPLHVQVLKNTPIRKAKTTQSQRVVKTEAVELTQLARLPAKPNRRLCDAITKAERSQ